jgi:hypothetical protein
MFDKSGNAKQRDAMKKFALNARILKIQIAFYQKLLNTTSGKYIQMFQKMKNLPERSKGSKPSVFQTKLQNLVNKGLKQSYRRLYDEYLEGEAAKKRVISILVEKAMGNNKKYFLRWDSETKNFKIINRCRMTVDFFENLNMIVDSNFKSAV